MGSFNKGGFFCLFLFSMVKIMISMPVGFQSQQIKPTGAIYRMFPLFHFGGGKKFSPYGCPPTMCFSCGVIGQEKGWKGEEGGKGMEGIISPRFPGAKGKKCKNPILTIFTTILVFL